MKAKLQPLFFAEFNDREQGEFAQQMKVLRDTYGEAADFLPPVEMGAPASPEADAIVFPVLIGAVFHYHKKISDYNLPVIVLTSEFATVEMWDWEIVSYLRDKKLTVFAPYQIQLAKVILRALATKRQLRSGVKFLMFQDDPGEGMQANIFKKFYWWEKECTQSMSDSFGMRLIYKSWKALAEKAKSISDEDAKTTSSEWNINCDPNLTERAFLSAVKLYIAAKEEIEKEGNVVGIGCNCLNESFYSDSTPCLAWNMLFEKDGIVFACEGDTLTLLSNYMIYSVLQTPYMMSNVYPFLVGMAALKHEKIDKFPDIEDADNHALVVHCGYFGLAARRFCTEWTLRPKVLEIVDDNAVVVDCRYPIGDLTMVKIYPDMRRLSIIQAEIEDYAQYPGSDCRNGAIVHYKNKSGHQVMENLCSHHAILIPGEKTSEVQTMAKVFGFESIIL